MRFTCIAALVVALSTSTGQAQTPVRVLSGFPPGGGVDTLARVFGEKLSGGLGRPVIVETRAGAAGQIAGLALKSAAPDGNTLLVAPDSSISLYPHTSLKPAYDTLADFVPVAHLGGFPIGFAVTGNHPAKELREYIAWAKQSPKNAMYGSSGYGSTPHFMGLMLGRAAGVPLSNIPYSGVGPALTDVVAGQTPAVMIPFGTLLPQFKAGKIRILAHSGSKRSSIAPDIPTFKELGFSTLEVEGWFGMFAPAGTRPEVLARYNEIIVQATRTAGVRDKLRGLDLDVREMTPMELAATLKADHARWGAVVKAFGFSAVSE